MSSKTLFRRVLLLCVVGAATMLFGFAATAHASRGPAPSVLPCPCDGGGPYVTPFFGSTSLTLGRTDQGVDYNGKGEIAAIGDGVVIGNGGSGWPGGHFLLYKLTTGTFAGKYIYVAEAINPTVSAGQHISEGQQIATFGANAAPGQFPGIEMGWGSSTLNLSLYSSVCGTYSDSYGQTAEGRAFARFLMSLGTPVKENPGSGPTYSTGCQTFGA